jgi:hypothetical protein
MRLLPVICVALSVSLLAATWLGYPLWLRLAARGRARPRPARPHARWPAVTLVVVVRNQEASVRRLLLNLLALAYPRDLRRILVVSDASSDFTDAIVRTFAGSDVQLMRTMFRKGRAAAERLAQRFVRGEVVVLADAATRANPAALAELVAPFADPTVGVAYGREVAAPHAGPGQRRRESLYRRFEAWLRELESRVFGTVSARGGLFAVRGELFHADVADWWNREFSLLLLARERGYRAVAVPGATYVVDRAPHRRGAYARRVGTLARDVVTLLSQPQLLNPLRYGAFSWMLLGHKVGRWLTPWALLAGVGGLLFLAPEWPAARPPLLLAVLACLLAVLARLTPETTRAAGPLVALRGALTSTVAMAHAEVAALRSAPAFAVGPSRRPFLARSPAR